ncbi:hypothetical protein BC832DRAFT_589127 [Gaertneriomyces semiglobifer]|nr:hypothetical protein BC832DRAFT_589127 [Gaertneriomyces semiglobifer]
MTLDFKRSSDSDRRSADYYLNVGTGIRGLREDLSNFFDTGLASTEIYAKDIAFTEPYHLRFRCNGRRWYLLLASTIHRLLRVYFHEAEMNILRIQEFRGSHDQSSDASISGTEGEEGEDLKLVVRWIFEGTPRHLLIANNWDILASQRSVYEGVFVYTFNKDGLIKEHRLEAIHPSPPLFNSYRWWRGYRAPVAPNLSYRAETVRVPVTRDPRPWPPNP